MARLVLLSFEDNKKAEQLARMIEGGDYSTDQAIGELVITGATIELARIQARRAQSKRIAAN